MLRAHDLKFQPDAPQLIKIVKAVLIKINSAAKRVTYLLKCHIMLCNMYNKDSDMNKIIIKCHVNTFIIKIWQVM